MPVINISLKVIIWILWATIFIAVFFYRIYLPSDTPVEASDIDLYFLTVLIMPAVVCCAIRWLAIPRIKNMFVMLITVFIGVTFAEAITFYGLYLFDGYLDVFFILSLIMIIQFIPIYLHKKHNK